MNILAFAACSSSKSINKQLVVHAAEVLKADALLISYAEHNGNYSAAYKNLYDWASRIDAKVFQGKPTVVLATSPGPGGRRSTLDSQLSGMLARDLVFPVLR